jgi:hypothetical protein
MDVLQINWVPFLTPIAGLAVWIVLAAAIYAFVEKLIDRRMAAQGRTKPSNRGADNITRL